MKTGLTYTETIRVRPRVVQKELTINDEWGMFSGKGNERLKENAIQLINDLKKSPNYLSRMQCFKDYYKRWRKIGEEKDFQEANDTAVREEVYYFSVKAGKCFNIDDIDLDKVW